MHLDPATHAVRADLADLRLADRVFAPHYAAPRTMIVARSTPLRNGSSTDSEALGTLNPGDGFEVLELTGANAWGTAPSLGLVGYVEMASLGQQ